MGMKPQIRFEGFSDDWEQRKLGEVATYKNGKGHEENQSDEGTYELINLNSISIDGGLKPSGKFIEDGSDTLLENDLVMVLSDVGHGDLLGRVAIIPENNRFVLNQRVALLRINDDTNPYFLFSIINRHQDYFKKLGAGSSQLNISRGTVENFVVDYPCQDEQRKIAKCFQNLDNLITLHQRKCDETKELKKFMLQKMFPKNGEQVPEIRFAGFTDEWEQRKVSEVAEVIGGGTPSTSNPEYWDGDINWYAPAEIGEQIYVESSERKITKLGLEKSSAKILPPHKTVLFTSRAGIGNTAILQAPAATNQGFQSMVLHDDINTYFVYSMTDMIKAKAERVASGSTFAEISGKMLGNLEFMFPSKPEQDKIGGYFAALDNLITLHQRKRDELMTLKDYMLQKLFPCGR